MASSMNIKGTTNTTFRIGKDSSPILKNNSGNLQIRNQTDTTFVNLESNRNFIDTGSAANPTLSFLGDTDTGIFSPSANTVSISTNGTERLRINSTSIRGANSSSIIFEGGLSGGVNNPGNNITIRGSAGGTTSGNGGSVFVLGGTVSDGNGGSVEITSANGVGTNRNGGALSLTSGNASGTGNAGAITITSGNGGTTSAGSNITITSGNGGSTSGNGGNILLVTGTPIGTGNRGNVQVRADRVIRSSGNFGDEDTANVVSYVMRNRTTNATLTELFINGSSQRLSLTARSTYCFTIHVTGMDETTGETYSCIRKGAIRRNTTSGTTVLVGTVSEENWYDSAASTWLVQVDADSINDSLRIRVQGQASKNIRWVARIETVETRIF